MTTLTVGERAIKDALLGANWPEPAPLIGLQNEHVDRVPEFVEAELDYDESTQETMGEVGHRRFRRAGVMYVRIHGRLNEGTSRIVAMGEAVLEAMEGSSAGGVLFRAADPKHVGRLKNWYVLEIRVHFEYFHHK